MDWLITVSHASWKIEEGTSGLGLDPGLRLEDGILRAVASVAMMDRAL